MNAITVIALPSCGTLLHDSEPMVLFGTYSLDEPITWEAPVELGLSLIHI